MDFQFQGGYDVGQVCLNGHVANFLARSQPEHNKNFCSTCGEKTIDQCPQCKTQIRGHYRMPRDISFVPEVAPAFCHNCGKPYPWMEDRLQTAKELLYHDDKLSLEEREKLWGLLQYVRNIQSQVGHGSGEEEAFRDWHRQGGSGDTRRFTRFIG